MQRVLSDLPGWAIKGNGVVLTVAASWSKENASADFTIFVGVAAYTITVGVMTWIFIISGANGFGGVGSAQEVGLHGDADVFLDLMVLTCTVTFQAGHTVSENVK